MTNCAGDCDGSGAVSLGEVSRCVNLFLGQSLCSDTTPRLNCSVADADNGGSVSIGELIQCVQRFINGCPPTPTATRTRTRTAVARIAAAVTASAAPFRARRPSLTRRGGAAFVLREIFRSSS